MKRIIFVALLIIANYQVVNAQYDEGIILVGLDYLTKDFSFDGNNVQTEAIFNVDEKVKFLDFNFHANISSGNLIISILDPNGRNEGQFELNYTQLEKTDQQDGVVGQISKRVDNPIFGRWKVKVISIKAIGAGNARIFNNNFKD